MSGEASATGIEIGPDNPVGPQREQVRITQQREGRQVGIGYVSARPAPSDVVAVVQQARVAHLGQTLDERTIGQVIHAVERQYTGSRSGISGDPHLRAGVFGEDVLCSGATGHCRHPAIGPEVEGVVEGQAGVGCVGGIRVSLPEVGVQVPEQAGHVEFPGRHALVAEELTGGGIRVAGLIVGMVEVDRLVGRNHQIRDAVQEAVVARVRAVGIGQHTNPLGIPHVPHAVGADGSAGDIALEDVAIGFEPPIAVEIEVETVFEGIGTSIQATRAGDHGNPGIVVQVGQHPPVFEDFSGVVQIERTALIQVGDIGQGRVPLVGLGSTQRQALSGGGEALSIKWRDEIRGNEQRGRLPQSGRSHLGQDPGSGAVQRSVGGDTDIGLLTGRGHGSALAPGDRQEGDGGDGHHRQHDQGDDQRHAAPAGLGRKAFHWGAVRRTTRWRRVWSAPALLASHRLRV